MVDFRSFLRCMPVLLAGCAATPTASPSSSPRVGRSPSRAGSRPGSTRGAAQRSNGLVPKLDTLFASAQHESHAPGMAVGIVLGGELVYAKGFGLRDLERKTPFDADTPFTIASETKGFTAMAILKLRDED